ncbi:SDR family oxidoreductase [Sorangium sp. So ce861]|uniref:SDR family oxidoreductase n=1 Tax=Sorangium sp. So ce861 TaxID=3133323 RepID=UPI003F619BE5
MRVLIPGITGQLGRMVAARLLEEGHEVIGIDRRPWPDAPAGVEMHNVDLQKRAAEDVFRKSRPQAVIHMATVTHLVEQTEERYRINLGGTRVVFDNSRACGVEHVIFVGRHTYYGAGPESPLYHKEEDPPMAVSTFPELADLVAADLYACTALWRAPELCTTVLRMCYTLGPTGHGTLASFLRGPHVPYVLGFDPLFQFMHEQDVVTAICLALEKRIRGVYNVSGPQPVPLSLIVRAAGRVAVPLPEFVLRNALGRFGLPKLPRAALTHIKYPVVVDSAAFRAATGFKHAIDEAQAVREYRDAHPVPAG